MISNCVFFAIGCYLKRGGYIVIHRSERGWWPHFLWSPDLVTFEQFHPIRHRRWYATVLRMRIPPMLFDGQSKPWEPPGVTPLASNEIRVTLTGTDPFDARDLDDKTRRILLPLIMDGLRR